MEVTQQQESNTQEELNKQQPDEVTQLKTELTTIKEEMSRMKQFFSSQEFFDILTSFKKDDEQETKLDDKDDKYVDIDEIVGKAVKQVKDYMLGQSIENAKKKYSDFETYRQDMIKLAQLDPSLSIDELYSEAKNYRTYITEKEKKNLNHRANQHNTTSVADALEKETPNNKKPMTLKDVILQQMRKLNIT